MLPALYCLWLNVKNEYSVVLNLSLEEGSCRCIEI